MAKTAVVLFNLGGPDSLEAIQPFLYNLFRDPDIFNIPIGQDFFARVISKRRAPKVAEQYKQIGGSSPIYCWTEVQRRELEKELRVFYPETDVFIAMRYWKPLTDETADLVKKGDYDKIILLPLYPQYSIVTTGSSYNEWNRKFSGNGEKIKLVEHFYENELYHKAMNERITEGINKFPEERRDKVNILFSAHGVPVSIIKKGDPYKDHIERSVELIMKQRNYSHPHHLCFQSKVGPVKWLEPATDTKIEELAAKGIMDMLIVPISFVSDHIETLFELDIEYREEADKFGVENYIMMEGLNDSPLFVEALKDIALKAIREQVDK